MKEIGGIPVVISRGAPYEIGYNHGKIGRASCRERV